MFSCLRKFIPLILACVSLVAPARGAVPTIRTISVSGNAVFTTREILGWLSSKPGLTFSSTILNNDQQTILRNYLKSGYYEAITEPSSLTFTNDSASVSIEVRVHEGRQTVVGSMNIAGQQSLTETEVLEFFETKPGNPLDRSLIEQDIDALLKRYEKLGYPFAECRVEDIARKSGDDQNLLNLLLRVDENEKVTIEELRVEGNAETDPSVVVRESRLTYGETFDPAKVDAIRGRLKRLNIFTDVSDPELYMHGQKGGLLIKVQEGNTNTFDGVLGYIPGTSTGESGYVTGLANVSMRNLFGTGRKFSLRWQREDRFSQELGLRYLEPWVAGFPVNLGGGFFQRKQDTTFVRRAFDLKAELMLSEELTVAGVFSTESIIPSDSTYRRVFKSSTISFGAEIQYDTRDDFYSPTSGVHYRTDYQYGTKRFSNIPQAFASQVKEKTSVQRISLDLDFFVSTFTRQVVALGVHGRELRTGRPEESEMFRFGGARTLRGYRENQFLGSRVLWSNVEYRFLLGRRSFLYAFVDNGYYLRPSDDIRGTPKSDAFKYGYGAGLQVETGLGTIGVSFALGEGDTFSNGKVHFGLINEF